MEGVASPVIGPGVLPLENLKKNYSEDEALLAKPG